MAKPQSFKPGVSGNPKGRPKKGYSITDWFKSMLNSDPKIKDAIGKSILKKALEGDITAQKLVWQYMDGMPKQEIAGDPDAPLIIERVVFKAEVNDDAESKDSV